MSRVDAVGPRRPRSKIERMKKFTLIFSAALIIFAAPPSRISLDAQRGAQAQPAADAGPFGALRWRSLGPPRGGRSIAVAGSVARPFEYYMGATGGGLWKTTDAGTTWR